MKRKIAVLAGDGIGPEVMEQALRVLACVSDKFGGLECEIVHGLVGGAAYEKYGSHFPDETKELCKSCDAILFGSVGGPVADRSLPKWMNCEVNSILALRKAFCFNANFRPVKVFSSLIESSPLKNSLLAQGVDILIVRELVGGIYFGEHKRFGDVGNRKATDVCQYDEQQIASVAHMAFKAALIRKKTLTLVDKANVIETSRLWRDVVSEVSKQYPDVTYNQMYVDNCAMQMVKQPSQFDVILTENMFGDILSDLAAVLPGSIGLLCSSSVNSDGFSLYEPPGGSAPDIAGQGIANPIGQIRCVAMMLEHSFGLIEVAKRIETSISETLDAGYRTRDIYRGACKSGSAQSDEQCHEMLVGSAEMTDEIMRRLSAVIKN